MERDHAVIKSCIRVAVDEYAEAQHEGLDPNAAFKCAIEGIEELLEVCCNCKDTIPYGFVPESGCWLHDKS